MYVRSFIKYIAVFINLMSEKYNVVFNFKTGIKFLAKIIWGVLIKID